MKITQEVPLKHNRQLCHTLVEGRDGKYYKVLTLQLYDRKPAGDFPLYETSVHETDEKGRWNVLVSPYLKRFKSKEEALKNHQELLNHFDEVLRLPEKQEKSAKHEKVPQPSGSAH